MLNPAEATPAKVEQDTRKESELFFNWEDAVYMHGNNLAFRTTYEDQLAAELGNPRGDAVSMSAYCGINLSLLYQYQE